MKEKKKLTREEINKKISESLIGIGRSDETKQRMSEAQKNRKRRVTYPNRPVDQFDLNENKLASWESVKLIETMLGFDHNNIRRCCNGQRKSANGFVWKWAKEAK